MTTHLPISNSLLAARRLSIAPMMDWTDRHCRVFHRLLAPGALLYTEMVTTGAVLHGAAERFLAFDPREGPVALQLGGSEPAELARAVEIAASWPYVEFNLNVGCPSDRVQSGRFGACLMAEPDRVAACVAAMRAVTDRPVTVKCRIGIDDSDEETFLDTFVDTVAAAGCDVFIVHARKAWLSGLSPKANREIPPLRYPRVRRLKRRRPDLVIVLNGGLTDPAAAAAELAHVDGVMIGREAYQNPWSLAAFTREVLDPSHVAPERARVVAAMRDYASEVEAEGTPVRAVARHMLGLYNGIRGARAWRRELSSAMHAADAGPSILVPLDDDGDVAKRPDPASAAV
ncbi:MAG: tRNA dihydrouridine(20/20a) synthase DusA [Geminicoccaceae bacterium]